MRVLDRPFFGLPLHLDDPLARFGPGGDAGMRSQNTSVRSMRGSFGNYSRPLANEALRMRFRLPETPMSSSIRELPGGRIDEAGVTRKEERETLEGLASLSYFFRFLGQGMSSFRRCRRRMFQH